MIAIIYKLKSASIKVINYKLEIALEKKRKKKIVKR